MRMEPYQSASIRVRVRPQAGMRLDRWFKTHFPGLGFGHLQKLLRSGQVRVDGGRAKADTRVEPGQVIRVPPLGVDRKGVENYQLLLGGSEAEDVSLAKITGPGFDENGIVNAVETVTTVYERERQDGERFVDTYRRIGMNPFKEALYG